MNSLDQLNESVFHPSFFESQHQKPVENRTLLSIREERSKRLLTSDVAKLKSPGSFPLTEDGNLETKSQSNTKYLFRNLYGDTLLTSMFFSDKNIKSIQNMVRFLVHKETNYIIDEQSNNELLIIMRSIFLEYSAHPALLDPSMTNDEKTKLLKKYTDEVTRLNEIVIQHIVPRVLTQLQQYLDYLRDASQPPSNLQRPESVSVSGTRQYRSITEVLIGGNL